VIHLAELDKQLLAKAANTETMLPQALEANCQQAPLYKQLIAVEGKFDNSAKEMSRSRSL